MRAAGWSVLELELHQYFPGCPQFEPDVPFATAAATTNAHVNLGIC